MEPKAISNFNQWWEDQKQEHDQRQAIIAKGLQDSIPRDLVGIIEKDVVIEALLCNSHITITISHHSTIRYGPIVEDLVRVELLFEDLKRAWRDVVSIDIQKLTDEGNIKIRFDIV